MNSILDAILAAQTRNKEEDRLRELRQQEMAPVLPVVSKPILPLPQGGDGGGGPPVQDTRTYQEKYQDMVDFNRNKGLGAFLPGGMAIGLMNDAQIAKMEEMYPELRPEDPYSDFARSRFSNIGQIAFGRGYPTQQGRLATSIWDRITGSQPTWAESLAGVNYAVPTQTRNFNLSEDDGRNEGDIGGYARESLSYDSFDDTRIA